MLDCHNWEGDMQPSAFGSQAWHDFWMQLSAQYKNNNYVIAYEVMNEPYYADCTADMTTWQSVQNAYGWLIHDIRATGDNKQVIISDPQFWQPSDLGDPAAWASGQQPLSYVPNAMVTSHNGPYKTEYSGGLTYDQFFTYYSGKLLEWKKVAPVTCGEISFRDYTPDEIAWMRSWINFLDQNNIGYYIFMAGSNYQYIVSRDAVDKVFAAA
jgi:hypothetical protein